MITDVLAVLLQVLMAVGAAVAFAIINARLLVWAVKRGKAADKRCRPGC